MENKEYNNPPLVSVVIPTYNRPHLIGRAVQSVLNQTYQNFEIVVIDDSPNDETEQIIKSFNDQRIKYIKNKERKGPSAARNQGIKASDPQSKYIAFLDDDDEYLPQLLEKAVKKLEENSDIVMVCTDAEMRDENGRFIREMRWNFNRDFWRQAIGNGSVVRRDLFFKENIWFDENLVVLLEDVDISLRALKNKKWDFVPEILRIYYHYPRQKSTNLSTYATINRQWLLKDIDYFLKKNLSIYENIGKEALSWLYLYIGKYCLRVGIVKEGRIFLKKAFMLQPKINTLFYYLIALFFPKLYQFQSLAILKHKILRIFNQ
jgi:glycosyltransferase involved in cell wall biosynthesis